MLVEEAPAVGRRAFQSGSFQGIPVVVGYIRITSQAWK
jgi:hypothetical protein